MLNKTSDKQFMLGKQYKCLLIDGSIRLMTFCSVVQKVEERVVLLPHENGTKCYSAKNTYSAFKDSISGMVYPFNEVCAVYGVNDDIPVVKNEVLQDIFGSEDFIFVAEDERDAAKIILEKLQAVFTYNSEEDLIDKILQHKEN